MDIDTTILHRQIVAALLAAGITGVRVYGKHEPPPWRDADRPGDTETPRWCRVANYPTTPRPRRTNAGDVDAHTVAVTITVGANTATQLADPTRVEQDANAIAHALRAVQRTDDGQRLTLERAYARQVDDTDMHEGHRLFVVMATGRVER